MHYWPRNKELFEFEGAEKLRAMKIGFRGVHRRPGQPVWMRGGVGAFVEIAAPDDSWGGDSGLNVCFKNIQWNTGEDRPGDGFGDFLIDGLRQGMQALNPLAEGLGEFSDIAAIGERMKMKEDGAAAVHLQIEISLSCIGAW